MRKILSLCLSICLLFTCSISVFADVQKTKVSFVGEGESEYEVNVPSIIKPGETKEVELIGTWDSKTRIVVYSDDFVYLYNNIDRTEYKSLEVSFNGFDVIGNNVDSIQEVENISVENLEGVLFGTWDGYINYYVTPVNEMESLAGTTWKFNEEISDCSFLGEFDYENQNGVLYYPNGSTITSGDISYEFLSLTRNDTFGITTLGTVASPEGDTFILYVYPNDLELDGWFCLSGETVDALNAGELTDVEEIVPLLSPIEPATITFPDISEEDYDNYYLLQDMNLISWLRENATLVE